MNWSQKLLYLGAASAGQEATPEQQHFPGNNKPPCEDVSSGAPTIPGLYSQGEQGLIAAGSGGTGGALAAFPFSRARHPIPGAAQTLLAVLTWARQGVELCLCVLQSQLHGDKREGG